MVAWSAMFLSTLVVPYGGMRLWANIGVERCSMWNHLPFLCGYLAYLAGLFYYSLRFLFAWELEPACSFIIACENTRLAMKVHAFVTENYSKGKRRKLSLAHGSSSADEKTVPLSGAQEMPLDEGWPSLKQFTYFMFCPSLLYRDTYPRAPSRSWPKVVNHLLHGLAAIYITNLMFSFYIQPSYAAIDYTRSKWLQLLSRLFFASIWGGVSLLMLFYGLLHCWMNMWSEAMMFGDRRFYAVGLST